MKNKLDKRIIMTFTIGLLIGVFGFIIGITNQWEKVSDYGIRVIVLSFCYLIVLLIERKFT